MVVVVVVVVVGGRRGHAEAGGARRDAFDCGGGPGRPGSYDIIILADNEFTLHPGSIISNCLYAII